LKSFYYISKDYKLIHLHNKKLTYFGICNQLKPLLQKESRSKIIDLDFNFDSSDSGYKKWKLKHCFSFKNYLRNIKIVVRSSTNSHE